MAGAGGGGDAAKLEKNLRMLQRIVPGASDIVAQSPFVAVYAFDEGTQAWSREDIEGGLFLVRRGGEPGGGPLALVVINRANANNLVRLVGDGFEMDDSDEYLMFRSPEGVYGLWFRYAEEKARVHAKLAELVAPRAAAKSGGALDKDRASGQMPALLQQMFLAESDRSAAPAAPAAPASFGSGPGATERFEMSKEQMKDVLLRLVQTDKFIDILHGQYLQKLRRDEEPLKAPQSQQHLGSPGAGMAPHGHIAHQQPVAPSPLRQPAHNMYHPHMPPPPFMYGGSPMGMGPPGGPPPPPPPSYGYHPPPPPR